MSQVISMRLREEQVERLHRLEIPIVALRDWRTGALLGAGDGTILTAAHADGRTLVTFDLRLTSTNLRV